MAKKTFQIMYPGSSVEPQDLVSGHAFDGKFPIEKLGIQAIPGTKFYLNGSWKPVVIGSTGIYELDLPNKVSISALRFDANSIKRIKRDSDEDAYKAGLTLLVDMVYTEG